MGADKNQRMENNESTSRNGRISRFSKWIAKHKDVIFGVIIALILYSILVRIAYCYDGGNHYYPFLLTGVMSVSFGWVVGIMISPYNIQERTMFSEYARLIYGFITGYVLSKSEILFSGAIDKAAKGDVNYYIVALIMFGVSCFCITVAVTYIARTYEKANSSGLQQAPVDKEGIKEGAEDGGPPLQTPPSGTAKQETAAPQQSIPALAPDAKAGG